MSEPLTPRPNDSAAEAPIEAVRRDVACPECGYNLRGLTGPVVACPECGHEADIAKLVARRWDRPWWKAPGFNTLLLPAAALALGVAFGGIGIGFALANLQPANPGLVFASAAMALMAVWGWLMWRTTRLFDAATGPLLALLAHVALVVEAAGVILFLGSLLGLIGLATGGWPPLWSQTIFIGVMVLLGVVLCWVGRRIERYIAGRCIRRYLEAEA